jgi:hypothetical protein
LNSYLFDDDLSRDPHANSMGLRDAVYMQPRQWRGITETIPELNYTKKTSFSLWGFNPNN